MPFLEPLASNDRYTLLRVIPAPAAETSLSPQPSSGGSQAPQSGTQTPSQTAP